MRAIGKTNDCLFTLGVCGYDPKIVLCRHAEFGELSFGLDPDGWAEAGEETGTAAEDGGLVFWVGMCDFACRGLAKIKSIGGTKRTCCFDAGRSSARNEYSARLLQRCVYPLKLGFGLLVFILQGPQWR